jgi:hypothetical protein
MRERSGRGNSKAPADAKSPREAYPLPPDVIIASARGAGVVFVLAPDHALFTEDWRSAGRYDPLIASAIKDNYAAILAYLIREAEGRA